MSGERHDEKSGGSAHDPAYSRRDVVRGAGATVTCGMIASALGAASPQGLRAAESAQAANCLTAVYPAGPGLRFDADYYRNHHMVTIMRLYGPGIRRFELRIARPSDAASSLPGEAAAPSAPHFAAAVNIWIKNLDAFNAANQKHSATLVKDVPNFTNAQPTIQYDRVYGTMGEPRSDMKVGDTCLTILYPNGEHVRWDVDYYRRHHMPLIMQLYGRQAIKRFELRKGALVRSGGKPPYVGTVNIYVNDQAAFDAAQRRHAKTLVADVPHFSSVQPIAFPTTIYGVA